MLIAITLYYNYSLLTRRGHTGNTNVATSTGAFMAGCIASFTVTTTKNIATIFNCNAYTNLEIMNLYYFVNMTMNMTMNMTINMTMNMTMTMMLICYLRKPWVVLTTPTMIRALSTVDTRSTVDMVMMF